MKKILGLDLGTNSIGWALIEQKFEEHKGQIIGLGSRIIPMDQASLGDFEKGNPISQTAERTKFRSIRRLRERHLLRRERLHRVLNVLEFLPEHYAAQINFSDKPGQFMQGKEPKLVYRLNPITQKQDFIFLTSFNEMMDDFKSHQPDICNNGLKVPYDWTIYFLRKKALTHKIEKEELAWLLLNFNQKRGYYQLRGEDESEEKNKKVEYHSLLVMEVNQQEDIKKGDEKWYNVVLENGWVYHRKSKAPLDWVGKTKEFIVTTELNEDGTVKIDRDGKEKRSFRAPAEEDWTLVKQKTENEIEKSNKTAGCYIYDKLLENPAQKVRGKLIRTIERKFYRNELTSILEKQREFHSELQDRNLYQECIQEIYRTNDNFRNGIENKDFLYLFLDDIIFYQRPLKSKKSLISNCRYETREYKDKHGNIVKDPIKCAPKSHPLFQEFRLWQFVHNLRIYQRGKVLDGKLHIDVDVTNDFLKIEGEWVALFEWMNDRQKIDQKTFFKYPPFQLKKLAADYRWNYVEEKIYPANETRGAFLEKMKQIPSFSIDWMTREREEALWHILYSVKDKKELEKALVTFGRKNDLDEAFAEVFKKFPPFANDYGAYSVKALKKLLPLMRKGRYWNEANIDQETKVRLSQISERLESIGHDPGKIQDISDDYLSKNILKSLIDCTEPFQGLNTYQACYAVYGKHSEANEIIKWSNPADIDQYLRDVFKQHSLRNPVVEKVIAETLRVISDIWKKYGESRENFFNEIHIELGREMKNPADVRKRITESVTENENTNLRIKALLAELSYDKEIENVRPYSPGQMEILKIYEEGALNSSQDLPDDIIKISKNAQPTNAELTRYKLWMEQKYRSPYTGEVIPLGKLFTPAYEIEHVIPQARFFDDSFNNKVICESEVNKEKSDWTAYEFIRENSGKIIELSFGKTAKIFTIEEYEDFIKENYARSKGKMKRLLMDEIPDSFIDRQMNDTRYISTIVKTLLSNIVREENEQEATSKNILSTNGAITTRLKQDWGMHDVWNEIITPRFERLNSLSGSNNFGEMTQKDGKQIFQTRVPIELQKGFTKKRIDHRHHAMDALVIACATRNHINYLNNQSAKQSGKDTRYDLRCLLCYKDHRGLNGNSQWSFTQPWDSFTMEAKDKLLSTIVSFKQNTRIINKTVNYYQVLRRDEKDQLKKVLIKQEKGDNWAIRKPLHKDTVAGAVCLRCKKTVSLSSALDEWKMIADKSLRHLVMKLTSENFDKKKILKYFKEQGNELEGKDISRVEISYFDSENVATRVKIDDSFSSKTIESITDTGIRKIMLSHLAKYNELKDGKTIEHPELAFSEDGIDEMNKNIMILNHGKFHKPIYKVRTFELRGNKFQVGTAGNKSSKFVEAAKGTNLFFAIYQDSSGKRSYESIPLNEVIERQKQGLQSVPETNAKGHLLLFFLSPNDLVYIPNTEEIANSHMIKPDKLSKDGCTRIYKMVSSSGAQCFFIGVNISSPIWNKVEYSALNKMEKSIEGIMIKDVCRKLHTDRLGNILNFQ